MFLLLSEIVSYCASPVLPLAGETQLLGDMTLALPPCKMAGLGQQSPRAELQPASLQRVPRHFQVICSLKSIHSLPAVPMQNLLLYIFLHLLQKQPLLDSCQSCAVPASLPGCAGPVSASEAHQEYIKRLRGWTQSNLHSYRRTPMAGSRSTAN